MRRWGPAGHKHDDLSTPPPRRSQKLDAGLSRFNVGCGGGDSAPTRERELTCEQGPVSLRGARRKAFGANSVRCAEHVRRAA